MNNKYVINSTKFMIFRKMPHRPKPDNPKVLEKQEKHRKEREKHREDHLLRVCECPICQKPLHLPSSLSAPFVETGFVKLLNCSHRLHAWCFYFNEKHNRSLRCPMCRGHAEPFILEYKVLETNPQVISFSDFFFTYSQVRIFIINY